jgi:sec-independent protein translocase protein TatC
MKVRNIFGNDGKEKEMPFLDHLEELRLTIFRCLAVFGIAFAISIPLAPFVLKMLISRLNGLVEDPSSYLQTIDVAGAFIMTIKIASWFSVLIASPFLLFFLGQFIFPGLKIIEKKAVIYSLAASGGLFVFGVLMSFSATLPLALKFMMKMNAWLNIVPKWTVSSYVAFCIQLLIGFGLAFQLPIVILVLGKLGILNSVILREKRRHIMVGLLVMAMLLTPPDVLTQIMMALPLFVLYEICIWILYSTEKKSRADADKIDEGE